MLVIDNREAPAISIEGNDGFRKENPDLKLFDLLLETEPSMDAVERRDSAKRAGICARRMYWFLS